MDSIPQHEQCVSGELSRRIVIVGRAGIQDSLLAGLLARHLGPTCAVVYREQLRVTSIEDEIFALLDAAVWPDTDLEARLDDWGSRPFVCGLAIFNADEGDGCERLLAWPKLKGLFYRDTGEEQLVKGVRAMLDGECWLPRRLLSAYLERTRASQGERRGEAASLTRKEAATLRAMIDGASNADIAGALHVSPHTVKTHVYNLFRKIKVSNRVQAVSWALKNIERVPGEI